MIYFHNLSIRARPDPLLLTPPRASWTLSTFTPSPAFSARTIVAWCRTYRYGLCAPSCDPTMSRCRPTGRGPGEWCDKDQAWKEYPSQDPTSLRAETGLLQCCASVAKRYRSSGPESRRNLTQRRQPSWALPMSATAALSLRRQQERDEPSVVQQHTRLRVLVLSDSGPYPRGCFWETVVNGLQHDVKLRTLERPDVFFIKELRAHDVLIVNWDAINGDPSFGSDSALRWSEHRHPEVRWWVSKGGLLIIEGQAKLSVPTQAAYDALLGPGQMRLSGPSDPSQAGIEEKRVGKRCRVTTRVHPDTPLGPFMGKEISSEQRARTFEEMFPDNGRHLLLPLGPRDLSVRGSGWNYLYRGWFKSWLLRPPGRWGLKWVRLVETTDRKWYKRPHPTMMAARYRQGAVFATTMLLSNINEEDLGFIDAILDYHHRVDELPQPTRIFDVLLVPPEGSDQSDCRRGGACCGVSKPIYRQAQCG